MSTILGQLSTDLFATLEKSKPKAFKSTHQLLQKAHDEAVAQFKNAGHIEPHQQYQLAQQFLQGTLELSKGASELLGEALHVNIGAQNKQTLFGSPKEFEQLLTRYQEKISAGQDMQHAWLSLYRGYLNSNPDEYEDRNLFDQQLEILRRFLEKTWPDIKKNASGLFFDLRFVDSHIQLLEARPWEYYSQMWLDGLDQRVIDLVKDLEIPSACWFWEKLFVQSLQAVVNLADTSFKKLLPNLLLLLDACSSYRDLGLQLLIERFSRCENKLLFSPFREYLLRHWGSPVGYLPKNSPWNELSESGLSMAKSWHHETNLRIFYALKTGDKDIAQDKLHFWLSYVGQITGSKLALGSVAQKMVQSQSSLKRIFNPNINPVAKLLGDTSQEQNALMMTIGKVVIIDFIMNDGCYIYEDGTYTFNIQNESQYATTYKGGLKEKYGKSGASIPIEQDWKDIPFLKILMSRYGIF